MTEEKQAADSPKNSPWQLSRRLWREYLLRHVGKLVIAAICMIVVALMTGAQAMLLEPAFDRVLVAADATVMLILPLVFLGVILVRGLASYGQAVFLQKTGLRVVEAIQNDMFGRLIGADLNYIDGRATGTLISRFLVDVQQMREALSNTITSLLRDSLTVAALIAVMFSSNWRMASFAFIAFPLSVLFITNIGRRLRRVFRSAQVESGELTRFLDNALKGLRQVKAYGMEWHEASRGEVLFRTLYGLYFKAAKTQARATPTLEAIGGLVFAGILAFGGYQVQAGQATVGSFMAFFAATLMAYQPMRRVLSTYASLQLGLAAADRVFEIIDHETNITDRPGAKPICINGGTVSIDAAQFSYGDNFPALHEVTLEAPAGKMTALVGPSGGGKSTILNLIPRFYDLDKGSIVIDGQDVRSVTLESLRGEIAFVSQDTGLFDDTVRANIAYGRPDASEDDIAAAAEAAAADGFIRRLSDGYDTQVGERGVALSGGQRQRVSIARAMLRNAPILLLDEATSALDTESERHVQAALRRLMEGRTTIVIAHRLSTVVDADLIHVIDAGRVVESGTHNTLMDADGLYARLNRMQFQDEPQPDSA